MGGKFFPLGCCSIVSNHNGAVQYSSDALDCSDVKVKSRFS